MRFISYQRQPWAILLMLTSMGVAFANDKPLISISHDNGKLDVQAQSVSAYQLAEALSDALSVPVFLTGDKQAVISLDFQQVPVAKALSMISPNHLIMRETARADSAITEILILIDQRSAATVNEIAEGNLPQADQFNPSATISITKQGESISSNTLVQNTSSNVIAQGQEGLTVDAITGMPGPIAFDPVTGEPIDPVTGLPIDSVEQLPH